MDLPRLHYNASISVAWKNEVVVSAGFAIVLFLGGFDITFRRIILFLVKLKGDILQTLFSWDKLHVNSPTALAMGS